MTAKLQFIDLRGNLLIEQPVELRPVSSYPVNMVHHGLTNANTDLGTWVVANGSPHEVMAGTIHFVRLLAKLTTSYELVAKMHYSDLQLIKVGGPPNYPGPGLNWSMNFMPILKTWCMTQYLPWMQAGGHGRRSSSQSNMQTQTSAEIRDALLRAIFAPDDRIPETQRATRYITPMAQRTPECPCGVHHSVCSIHEDWLRVE